MWRVSPIETMRLGCDLIWTTFQYAAKINYYKYFGKVGMSVEAHALLVFAGPKTGKSLLLAIAQCFQFLSRLCVLSEEKSVHQNFFNTSHIPAGR